MRAAIASLAISVTVATGIAIPQTTTGDGLPPFPTNTTIFFYNVGGWPASDSMCLVPAGNATIQTAVCHCLDYPGIGIAQAPNNDCSLTVYYGTSTCSNPTNTTTRAIPSGDSQICIDTPVNAGQKASGVWDCR